MSLDVDELGRGGRQQRHGRRGSVFSVRLTDEQKVRLVERQAAGGGPRSLGAFLVWCALRDDAAPPRPRQLELPCPGEPGTTASSTTPVVPRRANRGTTSAGVVDGTTPPAVLPRREEAGTTAAAKLILEAGTTAAAKLSAPYEAAGYRVVRVTLPDHDVRTYIPPAEPVWGILAAPPCESFSLARNGHPTIARDFVAGMACVNACLRIVQQCAPRWWALENPHGLLSEWLGTPRDYFEPCDFGDAWTKRTALWGSFTLPRRGPYIKPLGGGPFCKVCDPEGRRTTWCSRPEHRAITAPGFARAFFEANP